MTPAKLMFVVLLVCSVSAQEAEDVYGSVKPSTVDFGQVLVGQTSKQKRVSLTNTGDSEMTISGISVSGDFALPVNHCGNGVKPKTHCDVYVTFTPTLAQTETGTLTFTDNASNSPQTVSLIGSGVNSVATKTRLIATPSDAYVQQPVTLQATIAPTVPDGEQVMFTEKHGFAAYGTTRGGVATVVVTNIPYGISKVVALYSGDPQYRGSGGATRVNIKRYSTTTTLTSSPNPSASGQTVEFTAVVSSEGPQPIGCVSWSFWPGRKHCQYVQNGQAVIDWSYLEAGDNQVTATFEGDQYNEPSTASIVQVVNPPRN